VNVPLALESVRGTVDGLNETLVINAQGLARGGAGAEVTLDEWESGLSEAERIVSRVQLDKLTDLTHLDKVEINDDKANTYIRLSDALVHSGKVVVNMADDNTDLAATTADDRIVDVLDFRINSNLATDQFGAATVYGFAPDVDMFGVATSAADGGSAPLLTDLVFAGLSATGNAVTDGQLLGFTQAGTTLLDAGKLGDANVVRDQIASLIGNATYEGGYGKFGVLLRAKPESNPGSTTRQDWGLFYAEWRGGSGTDVVNSADLKVAAVAVFADFSTSKTLTDYTLNPAASNYAV